MRFFIFTILLIISVFFSTTHAAVISVNIIDQDPGASAIGEVNGIWGINSLGSNVDGWINTVDCNISALALSDGTPTSVSSSAIRPNWNNYDSSGDSDNYNGTPLRAFINAYLSAGNEPHITIENLNMNFPQGCTIIAYLGGTSPNNGASVSLTEGDASAWNKTSDETYYYKTRWNPDANNANGYLGFQSLQRTTEEGPLSDSDSASAFPNADYAVFENVTADIVTLTVDGMKNAAAGLSGFQIIGESSSGEVTIFEDDFGNGSGWGSSTAEAYNQLPSTTWDVTFNHGASANGGVYQHSNLIEFWRVSNASVSNAITLSRNFIAEPDTLYELEISAAINNGDINRAIPIRIYNQEQGIEYITLEQNFSGEYNLYGSDYSVNYNNFETRSNEFQLANLSQIDSNATIEVQLGGSFGGSDSYNQNSVAIQHITLLDKNNSQNINLFVYSQGNGSVSPSIISSPTPTNIILEAMADTDWLFTGWSGGIIGGYETSTTNVLLESNMNIIANFSLDADGDGASNAQEVLFGTNPYNPDDYPMCELQVSVNPAEAAAITPSSGLYKINSVVDLSASINNGWVISGWNNATRSEDDITSATVLMSNDVVVTATFTQDIEGQNYYFSSVSGNDANPGTIEEPLQTVDAINSKVFYPGDSILFKRGETFIGAATLTDKGTPDNPIVIDAYGEGAKPHLIGSSTEQSVFTLIDVEGFEFRNLHISHYDKIRGDPEEADDNIEHFGIYMAPTINAGDLKYLKFIDLDFSDIIGGTGTDHYAVGIYGLTPDNDNYYIRFSDILVQGCTFEGIDGVGVWIKDQSQNISDQRLRGTGYFPTTGVVIESNYGKDVYRNLCRVNGTKGAVIQYNIMDTTSLGSGFWPFSAEDTLVQYNLFMHTRNPGADSYVCHYDYNCHNTIMQYNIGYDVDGGLVQLIAMSEGDKFFQTGAIARYNIGIDVGFRNNSNAAGILINGRVDGGQVYNNTILQFNQPQYNGISFKNWGGGDWSQQQNNQIFNNLFYAAGTQSTHFDAWRGAQNNNVIRDNLYWGNIQPPDADVSPSQSDPKLIDASLNADFITFLESQPTWEQLLIELGKKFKISYGSGAIGEGSVISENGGLDLFSNIVSQVSSPSIGFHEYREDNYVDSDGDKIPDYWELLYSNTLDPLDPVDARLDADNDGMDHLTEFAFSGDPSNNRDLFFDSYEFEINELGVTAKHIIPLRSDWNQLGLVAESVWCSNLIENIWTVADVSFLGVGINGYTDNLHSQTNKINVPIEEDSIFIKTTIR